MHLEILSCNRVRDTSMINTGADVYLDIQGLGQLKGMANRQSRQALREVARQFEAVFVKMMLKSMREASFGDPLFDSETSEFYRDMYDHQLSLELTKNGSIGLADMLVRQLGRFVEPQQATDGDTGPATWGRPSTPVPAVRPDAEPATGSETIETLEKKRAKPVAAASKPEPELSAHDPESFIRALWPLAERSARELGTSPSVLLAQAGLETGWGRYVLRDAEGRSSRNLFNIKADHRWKGDTVSRTVVEYRDGIAVKEQARFRAYESYAESFRDYVDFLKQSPRYLQALQQAADPRRFISELHRAGYATDPRYAEKIIDIMQREPSLRPQALEISRLLDG